MTNLMEEVHGYYEFILPLVLHAGKVMIDAEDIEIEFKKEQPWNLVTVYDRKIEKVLVGRIKEKYPDHRYIGEEETEGGDIASKLTNDPTWIIDPIDGTANFVRDMPITCISVGLTLNKVQVLGVVYNPYMNELFTAIKGEGAYLNGKKIRTSGCKEIRNSIMNYEVTLARKNEYHFNLYMFRFKHLIKVIQGFRSMGCAVLSLCYVACGRTDAYQADGLYPWDAAAGTLILTEAGGYVTDSSGKKFDLMDPNFLATSTRELADQYMEVERTADEELMNFSNAKREFIP